MIVSLKCIQVELKKSPTREISSWLNVNTEQIYVLNDEMNQEDNLFRYPMDFPCRSV
jgi:hypothetical protein